MLGVLVKARYPNVKDNYVKLYLEDGRVVDEHRYVMTQLLNRELLSNEVVHHKDENKKNNDPSNLELKLKNVHAQEHGYKPRSETHVLLLCANCGKEFEKPVRDYKVKVRQGQKRFCCSRSCGVVLGHKHRGL